MAVLAIPYVPLDSGEVRVQRPKMLVWDECEDFDMGEALESFFTGVAGHEKGSAIMNQAFDETE